MKRYYVVPSPEGGWAIKEDAGPVTTVFKTKVEAVRHARQLAREDKADIVVQGRDGRIQSTTIKPLGFGSLRGQYRARKGVDLTKPIYDQVRNAEQRRG